MPPEGSISLETRILDLPNRAIPRFGSITARKLALGLAGVSSGKDINSVTVEDLLHYLPMRYEDRSNLRRIRDLSDGLEASLELYVKLAGGYQVRSKRSFKQRLFIFEISATDRERDQLFARIPGRRDVRDPLGTRGAVDRMCQSGGRASAAGSGARP